MKYRHARAFTIIEMLVVISIIALLAGILFPAISRARSQALLTKSQSNLRNVGTAYAAYASEWGDRQYTAAVDNITSFGDQSLGGTDRLLDAARAYAQSRAANPADPGSIVPADWPPPIALGWYQAPGQDRFYSAIYFEAGSSASGSNFHGMEPITFSANSGALVGFGYFRLTNVRAINQYVNGRFYDPVFYAPKDTAALDVVNQFFDDPNEYVPTKRSYPDSPYDNFNFIACSSYCLSPAALLSPDVLGNPEQGGYKNPWSLSAGLRAPSMAQIRYSTLKTHMLEHSWLQQRRTECNPSWAGWTQSAWGSPPGNAPTWERYNLCEPYFFNHGWESTPVTLFYDGHVGSVGSRQAEADDNRMRAQNQNPDWGLWSQDTPLGGSPDGGYFMSLGYDFTATSFHILTTEGARGRDILSR